MEAVSILLSPNKTKQNKTKTKTKTKKLDVSKALLVFRVKATNRPDRYVLSKPHIDLYSL